MDAIIQARAYAYDEHYRTAGWKAQCWTRQKVEAFLAYTLESPSGGNLNGNEINCALKLLGMPNVAGKTILDYCCGTGITAIYLAMCGAKVHAFDASRAAIDMAVESARLSGVADRVDFSFADAQHLPYPDGTFDAAFCQSALHIVIDYPPCSHELARVLKPRAKALFCEEALAYNPILKPIRWLRRRTSRDCGGRPLSYGDIRRFGFAFTQTEMYHFNLFVQCKQFFGGYLIRHGRLPRGVRPVLRALDRLDRGLLAIAPWLRHLCGKVVVEYVK